MAGYELNFNEFLSLDKDLSDMEGKLKSSIKDVGKQIGNQLKSNTEKFLPRESSQPKWGTHASDEVKCSVTDKNNQCKITVKGGSVMGKLWWLIDNGHVAQNGRFVPGAHFTDKAYNATDVEGPVNKLLNEVAKDG